MDHGLQLRRLAPAHGITRKSFITAFGARRGMKIMPRATVIVLTMIPLWPAISRAVTVRISAIAPSSTMA